MHNTNESVDIVVSEYRGGCTRVLNLTLLLLNRWKRLSHKQKYKMNTWELNCRGRVAVNDRVLYRASAICGESNARQRVMQRGAKQYWVHFVVRVRHSSTKSIRKRAESNGRYTQRESDAILCIKQMNRTRPRPRLCWQAVQLRRNNQTNGNERRNGREIRRVAVNGQGKKIIVYNVLTTNKKNKRYTAAPRWRQHNKVETQRECSCV